jgi:hypothetical protein
MRFVIFIFLTWLLILIFLFFLYLLPSLLLPVSFIFLSSLQLLLHGLDMRKLLCQVLDGVVKHLEEFGCDGVDSFVFAKDREWTFH